MKMSSLFKGGTGIDLFIRDMPRRYEEMGDYCFAQDTE